MRYSFENYTFDTDRRELHRGADVVAIAPKVFDLLDFLVAPITEVRGFALNTGAAYPAEDVTSAAFSFDGRTAGTGIWNFHADAKTDVMTFTGSEGTVTTPVTVRTSAPMGPLVTTARMPRSKPSTPSPQAQVRVTRLRNRR